MGVDRSSRVSLSFCYMNFSVSFLFLFLFLFQVFPYFFCNFSEYLGKGVGLLKVQLLGVSVYLAQLVAVIFTV